LEGYIIQGVYLIRNKVNNKVYIGSSINIKRRWRDHIYELSRNRHNNIHLQNAWNKYGKDNFEFVILEEVEDKSILRDREQYWLNKYQSFNPSMGYNISLNTRHYKPMYLPREIIEKSALQKFGRKTPDELKNKISEIHKQLAEEVKMKSPEIYTKYFYYNLSLPNKKNIKLVYRIMQFVKLKNQSKEYIEKLRKQGIIVKAIDVFNINKYAYYKLYAIKDIDVKYRKILINKILDNNYIDGMSLREYIEYMWQAKNYHKGSNDELRDKESVILDILASYYIAQASDFETVKVKRRENKIQFISLEEYLENEDNDKKYPIKTMSEYQKMKFERQHKAQHKRWKQTSTYKFGILFTYDNHKDRIKDWDWINGQWVDYSDYHVRIERLIDPERPYTFEWCYVDTDNMFTFKGKKYYISNEVKEYQKRDVRERDHRLEYPLDHIIVLEQDGNVYFFNSYGDRINNDLIKEVS